jgi:hypothetical protein
VAIIVLTVDAELPILKEEEEEKKMQHALKLLKNMHT